jgi:hypothetical protein
VPDTRDPGSIIAAAEQAAGTGDYAAAEQLLREAAHLQETELGPTHPDLANTLNNLGVVCDMLDKTAEAEGCYRRAHAIATAALPSDHPFVATSRQNLEDFCRARGIPLEPTPPAPARPEAPQPAAIRLTIEHPSQDEPRQASLARPSRPPAIWVAGLLGLALMLLFAIRSWWSNDERAVSAPTAVTSPQPESTAPVTAEKPPSSAKPVRETTSTPDKIMRKSGSPVDEAKRQPPSPVQGPLLVADARLCTSSPDSHLAGSDISNPCDQAHGTVPPGRVFFYTRLKSASDTTVLHRWYRGDQLRQSVELRIRANPTGGYRTYSRLTVSGNGDDWRVELRAQDGALLHTERFNVR